MIKAALIDWLYAKGLVTDAVVVSEMVVSNWARRADIAVANGRLYGFEIKSEFDSLKRLPGQIESFQKHFDKVTVVAASKFIPYIVKNYPDEVGVLEVCVRNLGVEFRQIRSGRICEVKDYSTISSFMTKVEIERLLKSEGIIVKGGLPRRDLITYINTVPIRRLKKFALNCIKCRYKDTFLAFDSARRRDGSFESLGFLSKSETLRAKVAQAEELPLGYFKKINESNERAIDFSKLGPEFGGIPEDMPQTVTLRKKEKDQTRS